ncbi:MAG: aminotransferase class V-fold PLP-dependent enzyme [Myxococcales bacterium]|nr:aminotransferase class V-fold PLP-dependent enzyme [Myxococcales bacterium]
MTETSRRARLADRSLFSTLAYDAYLNHAGISPPSSAVVAAVREVVDDYAARGFAAWPTHNERRAKLRQRIASLIGASSDDVGFTTNTTSGVVQVAMSLPWKPGDRVLLFRGEFPSNVTPWLQAAKTFGLEVRWLDLDAFARSHEEGLALYERALAEGPARLVAVSAVQFQTGLRMPLRAMAEVAHKFEAELFVDAVQACGAVPVDVREGRVDYLACGSHKWLMGTEGAGFLYVDPARVSSLVPRLAGWLSHEEPVRFLLEGAGHLRYDRPIRPRADFIEGGNVPTTAFAALDASLGLIEELGVEAIYAHVQRYLDALEPALVERGFRSARSAFAEGRSGSLCLLPPEGRALEPLHRALVRERIGCAMPDGHLRFSPHWPNHTDELPTVIAALDRALRA